jgi:hypothetical protein
MGFIKAAASAVPLRRLAVLGCMFGLGAAAAGLGHGRRGRGEGSRACCVAVSTGAENSGLRTTELGMSAAPEACGDSTGGSNDADCCCASGVTGSSCDGDRFESTTTGPSSCDDGSNGESSSDIECGDGSAGSNGSSGSCNCDGSS